MVPRVLVSGVSGFLGGHIALQLLAAGYQVRGSVRSLRQMDTVRLALAAAGADLSRLEFVELDLLRDAGWASAAEGCAYLQHVASPFVLRMPADRSVLLRPAIDGTKRAIDAAIGAGVQRIVLTSSIAAIVYGHHDYSRVFTEQDWTNLDGPALTAYTESKTRAERMAWAIMQDAGRRHQLAVINPGVILGPLLDSDPGTSGALIVRLLNGGIPAAPRVMLGYADVRDVAAVHVAAMQSPGAGGHRFIVAAETLSLMDVADTLRAAFPDRAGKLPKFEVPNWLARAAARLDPSLRDTAADIGVTRHTDARNAVALLGRGLIPARDAVIAMATSVIGRELS